MNILEKEKLKIKYLSILKKLENKKHYYVQNKSKAQGETDDIKGKDIMETKLTNWAKRKKGSWTWTTVGDCGEEVSGN